MNIGGLISGYKSRLDIYPYLDLVVAVQANVSNASLTEHLSHFILDELLDLARTQDWLFEVSPKGTQETYTMSDMLSKGEFPKKIENRPPVHPLEEYTGVFTHPAFGDISFVYNQTEDALYFKHSAFDSKMEHYHFDLFKVVLRYLGSAWAVGFQFETGVDGKVGKVTFIELGFRKIVFERKGLAKED
jgi:hypothetical protein